MAGLSVGVSLDILGRESYLDDAAELEELGYSTLWLAGGQLKTLRPLADVVRATKTVEVASGIIPIGVYDAGETLDLYEEVEESDPSRLLVGLGGARGTGALASVGEYLDRLDAADPAIPKSRRILGGMGPRMLELARDRSAGATPFLVTAEHTAQARTILGDGARLVVQQAVVLETDARSAREAALGTFQFLIGVPGYAASFRRMGFTEDDLGQLSDRLVDGLVAWGDAEAISVRVREQFDAGADQVGLSVLGTPGSDPLKIRRELAAALIR